MSSTAEYIRHKITTDEYFRMGEAGVLGEDARIELIDGELIEMAPISPGHSFAVSGLHNLFAEKLAGRAYITSQNPIIVDQINAPQPDVVIAKMNKAYAKRHPGPQEIELIVEVAASSLGFDRNTKRSLYAAHGVPEYWILNLNDDTMERYARPVNGHYTEVDTLVSSAKVSPIHYPDVVIELKELLGL